MALIWQVGAEIVSYNSMSHLPNMGERDEDEPSTHLPNMGGTSTRLTTMGRRVDPTSPGPHPRFPPVVARRSVPSHGERTRP